MAHLMYVEEMEEGQHFSFEEGDQASVWKVDSEERTASLVCPHEASDRFIYLEDYYGQEVHVLSADEIGEHANHSGFSGDLPADEEDD